ncbi:MAG: rhombotarget lipoprotein [Nitrosomonadales bacterium]|nr:rhombotarget lipoprotein [Nitrosomonadales bacterium]
MKLSTALIAGLFFLLTGCASWVTQGQSRQNASVVSYLYPKEKNQVAPLTPTMTQLNLPVRVGIAFVPSVTWGNNDLPEAERLKMLQQVKDAFSHHQFIASIETIPSGYLTPQGGFTNLEQVASMFNVDVVALLSYDQVQFNDVNRLSLLYWTIVGAYLVNGDEYDISTMLDASIFDVKSRKLLMRAPGTSLVKGSAAMATFSEKSRAARLDGFGKALDNLVPQLQHELNLFKERIKKDQSVKVTHSPGYSGGGDMGWIGIFLVAMMWLGIKRGIRK